MPQMNDKHDTEINLTKVKLKEIIYEGGDELRLKYTLNDTLIETCLSIFCHRMPVTTIKCL